MCPRWAAKMGLARTSPCREHRDAIATGWSLAAVCVARGVQSCYREVAPLQNNNKKPPKLPKRQGSCGEDGRCRVSPWAGYTSPFPLQLGVLGGGAEQGRGCGLLCRESSRLAGDCKGELRRGWPPDQARRCCVRMGGGEGSSYEVPYVLLFAARPLLQLVLLELSLLEPLHRTPYFNP